MNIFENHSNLPPVLTLDDLGERLQFSRSTLAILISDRSFPLIEIGAQSFILRDSLIDWLRFHERSHLLNRRTGGVI